MKNAFKKRLIPSIWGLITATLMMMSVDIWQIALKNIFAITMIAVMLQFTVNFLSKEGKNRNMFTRAWNLFWEANLLGLWAQSIMKFTISGKFLLLIVNLIILVLVNTIARFSKKEE